MICPQCKNGFICEPTPKPLVLSYRGFSKIVATQLFLGCSNCLYEDIEPSGDIVDIDSEMVVFKREINRKLSIGDEL